MRDGPQWSTAFSGYTGRLVGEYLRESTCRSSPPDGTKVQEVVDRIRGPEAVDHEVAEVTWRYSLLERPRRRAGFASACQAFGYRELLGALRSFGVLNPLVTVHS